MKVIISPGEDVQILTADLVDCAEPEFYFNIETYKVYNALWKYKRYEQKLFDVNMMSVNGMGDKERCLEKRAKYEGILDNLIIKIKTTINDNNKDINFLKVMDNIFTHLDYPEKLKEFSE